MFSLFFMIAFVTGLQNPMGIIVKNQFKTSNFLSQLGNFANFIAYAFMGIPAGYMLEKIGYKKTAISAVLLGFIGVGVTFLSGKAESFSIYLIGALISGFSMCMLNTVVNPMLNTIGGEKRGNQLLQFGGTLNSIGATIVPVLVGYLIGNVAQANITDANPALFLAMGIFILAFIVLYSVNIPEPHISKNNEKHTHSPLSFRHFTLGAIAIFMYVGTEVGIANITNLYLIEELKLAPTSAGAVVGTYWFLMLIGRFIGAFLADKISSKTMLSFSCILAILFISIGFLFQNKKINMLVFQPDFSFGYTEVPLFTMLCVLCGLCTSVMWGGIFNLATQGLGKYTAKASGFFMVMICGGGIIPAIQGKIADLWGFVPSFVLIIFCLFYMLYFALIGSKNVNHNISTE